MALVPLSEMVSWMRVDTGKHDCKQFGFGMFDLHEFHLFEPWKILFLPIPIHHQGAQGIQGWLKNEA